MARPAVKCFVFAETRCEFVPGTVRTANGCPYNKIEYGGIPPTTLKGLLYESNLPN